MQANDGVHLGVDNFGVVRHVGRLLDSKTASRPAELFKDGDLILLLERMLRLWGLDNGADEAADFGRRRVLWWIIDARRNYSGVCARWRPLVLGLHRLFIAIARTVVNHDGVAGTALDPVVRSVGGALRGVGDRPFFLGLLESGMGNGALSLRLILLVMILSCGHILFVCLKNGWLFSFSLHWPQGGVDLGVGGVSYVELQGSSSLSSAGASNFSVGCSFLVQALIFGALVVSLVL